MMQIGDRLNNLATSRGTVADNSKSETVNDKDQQKSHQSASFDDYVKNDKNDKNINDLKTEDEDTQTADDNDKKADALVLLQQINALNNSPDLQENLQIAGVELKDSNAKAIFDSVAKDSIAIKNATTDKLLTSDLELQTALKANSDSFLGNATDKGEGQGENKASAEHLLSKTIENINFNSGSEKLAYSNNLSVGDKIVLPTTKSETSLLSRITDVQVVQNRQHGDVRVLQIQLAPDNLGTVDVRLRINDNGLHVELHAQRQETARLLADDHKMLTKALEGAGYKDDSRISISIVDKSQPIQSSQSSNAGQNATQGDNGQNLNRQNFGQNGQGGQNGSYQNFEQNSLFEAVSTNIAPEENDIYSNPSRLVV